MTKKTETNFDKSHYFFSKQTAVFDKLNGAKYDSARIGLRLSNHYLLWHRHEKECFVGEQVEEEASAMEIVDTLKCLDDDIAALYAFDTSLLARE